MGQTLETFTKKHDKIICFDSDGTVIDAMNIKHRLCHGAAFIDNWGLNSHAAAVQAVWDSINLYERTRGVNRFIALEIMLRRMDGLYLSVDKAQLEDYLRWVSGGDITNASLKKELEHNPNPLLTKALEWSLDLNKRIESVTASQKPPYKGVQAMFEAARDKVDLAVVSSSNMEAIMEEWTAHGLLKYICVITSQEVGSKTRCLASLKQRYGQQNVLMVGDAYPYCDVARANNVGYYPILTRHEEQSWALLKDRYLDIFVDGRRSDCQQELFKTYENNFFGE